VNKDLVKNMGNWQRKIFLHCLSFTLLTHVTSMAVDASAFLSTAGHLYHPYNYVRKSQWLSGLRQVLSSAARTLGSQVRILLGAWMFVCVFLCCVVLCRQRP
jgi:hypothetical protein